MLKKLLLAISILILSISSTYAVDTVFYAPDISMLPTSDNVGNASNNDRIAVNSNSRNQFCLEFGGTYTSHIAGYSGSVRARYIPSTGLWMNQANTNVLETLTCDIPEPTSNYIGLYLSGADLGTGSLNIPFAYQSNSGVYYIDQQFILGLILKIVITVVFIPLLFYTTKKTFLAGKKLNSK